MKQKVIKQSYANDFAEALSIAIQHGWFVKFMVANDYAFVAVLEM